MGAAPTNNKPNKKTKPKAEREVTPVGCHDPSNLLRLYRDAKMIVDLAVSEVQDDFKEEYSTTVEEYVKWFTGDEKLYKKLQARADSLRKTCYLLSKIDKAVSYIRKRYKKNGEMYYWILYCTYLSPEQYERFEDLLEAIKRHVPYVTKDSYYKHRQTAIEKVGIALWGFTTKEILDLDDTFLEEVFGHMSDQPGKE